MKNILNKYYKNHTSSDVAFKGNASEIDLMNVEIELKLIFLIIFYCFILLASTRIKTEMNYGKES